MVSSSVACYSTNKSPSRVTVETMAKNIERRRWILITSVGSADCLNSIIHWHEGGIRKNWVWLTFDGTEVILWWSTLQAKQQEITKAKMLNFAPWCTLIVTTLSSTVSPWENSLCSPRGTVLLLHCSGNTTATATGRKLEVSHVFSLSRASINLQVRKSPASFSHSLQGFSVYVFTCAYERERVRGRQLFCLVSFN